MTKNIRQSNVSGNNIVVSGSGNIVVGGSSPTPPTQRIQITESTDETNILQENITGNNIVVSGDKPASPTTDDATLDRIWHKIKSRLSRPTPPESEA